MQENVYLIIFNLSTPDQCTGQGSAFKQQLIWVCVYSLEVLESNMGILIPNVWCINIYLCKTTESCWFECCSNICFTKGAGGWCEHCTLYTVHRALYSVHCTVYSVQCTVYTVHCAVTTLGEDSHHLNIRNIFEINNLNPPPFLCMHEHFMSL